MKTKNNNRIVFILLGAAAGAVIGGIIWAFMRVMHLLIELLWDYIPGIVHIPGYTVLMCLLGGIVIGIIQKKYGPCPDDLHQVMAKYKRDGRYPYNNILIMLIAALMPLIFGGAIGPEAGLTGVIVGLCCWAGDNFKYAGKYMSELPEIGISTTLGIVFRSPLFGFIEPIENDDEDEFVLPKASKTTAIFCAVLTGFGIFMLLSKFLGSGAGMPRFEKVSIERGELLFAVPVLAISVVLGYVYMIFDKLTQAAAEKLGGRYFIMAVIAALVLGIIGTVFPIAMFSGEEEIQKLTDTYTQYPLYLLFIIPVIKVFLINMCIRFGWRGGSFFPSIFAGVCLGYACSAAFGIDPVFAVSISAAAVMTTIMRKPLAVALLLLLCFPVSNLIYILAAAFLASIMPVPKSLK